jgi:excisionase family DNA binding protein
VETGRETWLTKDEVMKMTGMSERTVERRVRDGDLRREYRSVPGRKSTPFFHPDDVEKLVNKTRNPVVLKSVPRRPTKDLVRQGGVKGVPAKTSPSRLLLPASIPPSMPIEKKLYLSLAEASLFSGLSKAFLRRLIEEKRLPAVKDKGYKIRRVALEQYDATDGDMTP